MKQRLGCGLAALMVTTFAFGAEAQQAAAPPSAAATPNTLIGGTITAFDGHVLSVKSRDGSAVKVNLPDSAAVSVTLPFSLADLKPGMMVAAVTVGRPDGSVIAINIRPLGGQAATSAIPFDLEPGATMNNAAVDQVVTTGGAQEVTLKTAAGIRPVLIVPQTTITQNGAGTRADLIVGEMVFVRARPDATGQLNALSVEVGKNGVEPGE